MVDAISSYNPGVYLNNIKGIKPVTPVQPDPQAPQANDSTSKNTSNNAPTPSQPVKLSSEVISLLQGISSSSDKGGQLSNLLGSASTSSNPLAGLYGTFAYTQSSSGPLQQALISVQQQQANVKASANTGLKNVLSSYHSGLNAYNQTLQQNAQSVLNEGTKLIA